MGFYFVFVCICIGKEVGAKRPRKQVEIGELQSLHISQETKTLLCFIAFTNLNQSAESSDLQIEW